MEAETISEMNLEKAICDDSGRRKRMNAEEIFEQIGFGKENSVSRPSNEYVDRKLRRIIERANTNGDCIISGKNGYYRPLQDRSEEQHELNHYLSSELHRARAILHKRERMIDTSKKWRDVDCQLKIAEEKELPEKENLQKKCENMVICVEEDSSIPGQMVMRMW